MPNSTTTLVKPPGTVAESPARTGDSAVAPSAPQPPARPVSEDVGHEETRKTHETRHSRSWVWLAALVLIGLGLYLAWRRYNVPASGQAGSVAAGKAGGAGAAAIPVVA